MFKSRHGILLLTILIISLIPKTSSQSKFTLEYELEIATLYNLKNNYNFNEKKVGTFSITTTAIDGIDYYQIMVYIEGYLDVTVNYKYAGEYQAMWGNSTDQYKLPFYLTPKTYKVGTSLKIEGNATFSTTGEVSSIDPTKTKYYGFQDGISIMTKEHDTILKLSDGGKAHFQPQGFYDKNTGILLEGFIFSFPIFFFITGSLITGNMHLKYSTIEIGPENAYAKSGATIGELLPILVPLVLAILFVLGYKIMRVKDRQRRRALRKNKKK